MDDHVHATPDFSIGDLRETLGLFATGVAIITATTREGDRLGLTVSSFNSVSLSPPLVLFSMARTAKSFDLWMGVKSYAINILNERQSERSTRFARALTDKWSGLVSPTGVASGAPLIDGALASLECRSHARHDGGDHVIMVGEVIAIQRARSKETRPLVFYGSRYRRLDSEVEIETPFHTEAWLHGW